MDIIKKLLAMREKVVGGHTVGLPDETLRACAAKSPELERAVEQAYNEQTKLINEFPHLAKLTEPMLILALHNGYVNFYPEDQSNPYVPVAAAGPWIVARQPDEAPAREPKSEKFFATKGFTKSCRISQVIAPCIKRL